MDNKILEITPKVQWIGVLDPNLKIFDIIMETKFGTTYNSYFINAKRKAIVEVVKESFFPTFEAKLRAVCAPEEVQYIVIDHTEPDHVGGLEKLLAIAPNATVVGSNSAILFLQNQVSHPFKSQIVKENDVIDLGDQKIRFISAPNLHWPDSIYSYLEEEKVLFTCDSFGAHFCHEAMYNNQVGNYDEAFEFYFNVILKPFSSYFLKAIDKIKDLKINAICTGHGPLLTHNPLAIVEKTQQLCTDYVIHYPQKNHILIAYVSAYGFTKLIAEKIKEGIDEVKGVTVDLCDIEQISPEELGEKLAKASAYLFGSPTINQNMLPQLYNLFANMTPLRDRCKLAGCFGSYGWTGEAKNDLLAHIETLKLKYFGENIFIKFKPKPTDYQYIKEYGKRFASALVQQQ